MLKNQLDQRLGAALRKKTTGDIGIELELEGTLKGAEGDKFWTSKEEGSLRNGVEYVLIRPVYTKELDSALEELGSYLSRSKPKCSIRCSTHMHINVLDKTIRQIYAIVSYYYLIEDLLVSTQGPLRAGNLFCLRMSDAEGLSESLRYSLDGEVYFRAFNMNHHKYGALNLAAPTKFGSLEFRFLRPLIDMKMMSFWAWLLYNMVENASAYSMKQIVDASFQKSTYEFLSMVFNRAQIEFLTAGKNEFELQQFMNTNIDHISKMGYLLGKKKKFYIPEEYLDDDLADSPHRISHRAVKMAQPDLPNDFQPGLGQPLNMPGLDWVVHDAIEMEPD